MDKQQDVVEQSELHPDSHKDLPPEGTAAVSEGASIIEESKVALPVEPTPPAMDKNREAAVYRQLLDFFLNRRRPDSQADASLPVPALLRPFRDLDSLRHEFPFCVKPTCEQPVAETLMQLVDQAIEGTGEEGDAAERLTRHFHQLEWSIKQLDGNNPGSPMDKLLDPAIERVMSATKLPEAKSQQLRADLEIARRALRGAGDVLPCNADAARRLMAAAFSADWHARTAQWKDELAEIIVGLENLLSADESQSANAASPDSLRDSVGSADLDFNALSDLLSESRLSHRLPEARVARVEKTLATLRRIAPLFNWCGCSGGASSLPFAMEPVVNDCLAAIECYRNRMAEMVEFFKAVQVARLDLENRYREELHDPIFAAFDEAMLSQEEKALCPPVLLIVEGSIVGKGQVTALLDMLTSDAPIKVLVQVDDLLADPNRLARVPFEANWLARLGTMAAALGDVYVLQTPVSRFSLMYSGFMDGLSYSGPALFSVFASAPENTTGLPVYLSSAAAFEARAFPAFTYDPAKGSALADRIAIDMNSKVDADWSSEEFFFEVNEGETQAVEVAMTPADFLLADKRAAKSFWDLPVEMWHRQMVPLMQYMDRTPETREVQIPYILAVDEQNRVHRIVVSKPIVQAVLQCRAQWRRLQELGGVKNSHAERLLAHEKQRLEDEKQNAIASVEEKFSAELDRNLDELTQEIVDRIAGQLLSEAPVTGAVTRPASPRPAPNSSAASVEEAATEPEAAPVEEEEESLSFDDPYIETPRCTTCNECVQLNGELFKYNENKQAFINDASAGSFRQLVEAAEKCPVHIIHPGKPLNPNEPGLDGLVERAAKFN
ncbi:ferredoxin [bacterium]|nr:ferredoxin [bacterium]